MNKIELFNEFCICYASLHLNYFTDWVPDTELQYDYGWSLLIIVMIMVIVNMSFVLYYAIRNLYFVYLKCYNFIKKKEKQDKDEDEDGYD